MLQRHGTHNIVFFVLILAGLDSFLFLCIYISVVSFVWWSLAKFKAWMRNRGNQIGSVAILFFLSATHFSSVACLRLCARSRDTNQPSNAATPVASLANHRQPSTPIKSLKKPYN